MMFLQHRFFIFSFLAVICLPASISAACIGSVPVYGTKSTWEDCAKKDPPQSINNKSSGQHNNVNIYPQNNPPRNSPETNTETSRASREVARHQARIELTMWVIPGADHFDTPGMPEKFFFNGAAYEYALNKNLFFGVLLQQFAKTGGRDFNDVSYTDASGDARVIASPGALERLQYTAYIPYVSVYDNLSGPWGAGFRFGIGRIEVDAEYKDSSGMGNKKFDDNTAMLIDAFLDWTWGDFRLGAYVRYVISNNDSNDYLDYLDMGGSQVGLSAQWMFRDLGSYK